MSHAPIQFTPIMRAAHHVAHHAVFPGASPEEHLDRAWYRLDGMCVAIFSLPQEYNADFSFLISLKSDCVKLQAALAVGLAT